MVPAVVRAALHGLLDIQQLGCWQCISDATLALLLAVGDPA
jgi:hypothetical protein